MKIILPWYTCSRVVEMYGDFAELEAIPSNSTGALKRINDGAVKRSSKTNISANVKRSTY